MDATGERSCPWNIIDTDLECFVIIETQTDNRTPRGHADRRVVGWCRCAGHDSAAGIAGRSGFVVAAERCAQHAHQVDQRELHL